MKRDSVYKRVLKRILNEEFNGDFEHATKDNVDSWDARKWGNMPPWLKTDNEREEYEGDPHGGDAGDGGAARSSC